MKELIIPRSNPEKTQPINRGTRRNPKIVGHIHFVEKEGPANQIFLRLFGYTMMQAFFRTMKIEKRAANRNGKSMWCVPHEDLEKVYIGYRGNIWNKSEVVPKEFEWLFEGMYIQYVDFQKKLEEKYPDHWQDSSNYREELKSFHVDYTYDNNGEDRKPLLYVCNLCGHEGEKDKWPWGSPTPGVASYEILRCPKCNAQKLDIFKRAVAIAKSENIFRPYSRWQDDLWFTL